MIEIRDGRLGRSVFTTRDFDPGTVILRGWGPRVPRRTRHSLQVDHDSHIEIRSPIELINHFCEPNCGVLIRRRAQILEIHALRAIEAGEELTTDYATFEAEIENMPGPCLCGSPLCRGVITGHWGLTHEQRAAFGPYIAEFLRETHAPAGAADWVDGSDEVPADVALAHPAE